MSIIKYQVTKKQCRSWIKGVCEGCGGKLEPIETVNNSGEPTYWIGCNHCSCFRVGIEREYFEIARQLVEQKEMLPYSSMSFKEYNDTPERRNYWLDTQTSNLSHNIKKIHQMIKEKFRKELS